MMIIGFTGLKGSGKDTAASVFIDAGFVNVKMADGLKAMLRALLAYRGADEETIERMLEGDLKETPSRLLGGRTPRYAMQTLGTEWGRNLMSDTIWVDATGDRCDQEEKVVITDVRFPNEVDFVTERDGHVYRVDRGAAPVDMHESEALIMGLPVAMVLKNDAPDRELFRAHVSYIFRPFLH
jgi:hypothetical protein